MRLFVCAAALGFALWGCDNGGDQQTTQTTFDALKAVAECEHALGNKTAAPRDKQEIDGLVSEQLLSPQDCAEYHEMLETIRETDLMLDEALELRDYASVGGAE